MHELAPLGKRGFPLILEADWLKKDIKAIFSFYGEPFEQRQSRR